MLLITGVGQERPFEQKGVCSKCGGAVKVIASIEDPVVIRKILDHRDQNASLRQVVLVPESRAPPVTGLFD